MSHVWKDANGAWIEIDRERRLVGHLIDGIVDDWRVTPGGVDSLTEAQRAERGYVEVIEVPQPVGVRIIGHRVVGDPPTRCWLTEPLADEDLEAIRNAKVAEVKVEAGRRILERYPTWKQANMNMRATELVDIRLDRVLTTDETAEREAMLSAAAWIKDVRAASDAIEAGIPTDAEGLCAFTATAADGWPA